MIVPFLPFVIAVIIVLAPRHDCGPGHVRNAMAAVWSRNMSPAPAQRRSKTTAHCTIGTLGKTPKPAPAHVASQAAPNADDAPRAKLALLQPAGNAAAESNAKEIRQQVTAATAVAEQVTAATAGFEPKVLAPNRQANPASPKNADVRVAVLMARPEIKSVADLASKTIALDDRQSPLKGDVRAAITAAGAAEIKLSGGPTRAIDRLIGGEVPAAVLTLVSPEAAEGFPEVAGFRIYRIPLPHGSSKARLHSDAAPRGRGIGSFRPSARRLARR